MEGTHMASANDPSQTENTTQQSGGRSQTGGNGGRQQLQNREDTQSNRQGSRGGRALSSSRGRRELSQTSGSPLELMWQLSRELDRMMSGFTGSSSLFSGNYPSLLQRNRDTDWNTPQFWVPRVDVEQRGDSIVVRADLPGVRKEDIQIDVTDEGLTISGERREEHEEGGEDQGYRAIERSYGSFQRTIPLPQQVNLEQLKAKMRDGVLQITVPLDENARPRRIPIDEE
jgi:HSP20 family protein